MIKRRWIEVIAVLSSLIIMAGCSSVPRFSGKGDLCGIIVDENNNPVSDYLVTCKKSVGLKKSVFTNESGIFVFPDMSSGVYFISGSKTNFLDLKETEYVFSDRSKLFCCQVMDLDKVLDVVIQNIKTHEYENGLQLLEAVSCKRNTYEELVINRYREFILGKINEMSEVNNEKDSV